MTTRSERARGHLRQAHRCSCGVIVHGNGARHSHEQSHTLAGEWRNAMFERERPADPQRVGSAFHWLTPTAWEAHPGGLLAKRDSLLGWAASSARRWQRLPEGSIEQICEQALEQDFLRKARSAETAAINAGAFVLRFSDNPEDCEVYATEHLARKLRPSMGWTDKTIARRIARLLSENAPMGSLAWQQLQEYQQEQRRRAGKSTP